MRRAGTVDTELRAVTPATRRGARSRRLDRSANGEWRRGSRESAKRCESKTREQGVGVADASGADQISRERTAVRTGQCLAWRRGNAPSRTRTWNPLIKSQLLCQ